MRQTVRHAFVHLTLLAALIVSLQAQARNYTPEECPVIGNTETGIYHVPGDRNYRQMLVENKNKKKDNRGCFKSRLAAENAGYRRSRSGKGEKPK